MRDARPAVGTIVSKDNLPFARVLARSFKRYHPFVPFFTLLADRVDGAFDPSKEPYRVVSIDDLEVPELKTLAFKYPKQQFSYALTASFLRYLLDSGFSRAVFIKQESLVLGSHASLFDLLRESSVVLTPHLIDRPQGADQIDRELNILLSGVFNGGIVGVSESTSARDFLSWWHERCSERCELAVEEGVHYEQRWLDLAPSLFQHVFVLRDPAYNVGHWNLDEREITVGTTGRVRAKGRRCRLFRFSGYMPDRPERPTRYSNRLSMRTIGHASRVFDRFGASLLDAGYEEANSLPYSFDRFDNGVPIPDIVRKIFSDEAGIDRWADPFDPHPPDAFYQWLRSAPRGGITNLWSKIHSLRPDVAKAFPEPLGEDREAFIAWSHRHGRHEHQIPNDLLLERVEGIA